MLRVPISTGRWSACTWATLAATACHLADAVVKKRGGRIVRCDGTPQRDRLDAEAVHLAKLPLAARGRARHPAQPRIQAEIALPRDLRQGLVFGRDPQSFLGLDRLVQAVLPGSIRKDPARTGIDDLDGSLADDVVYVAAKQPCGQQRFFHVLGPRPQQDRDGDGHLRFVNPVDAGVGQPHAAGRGVATVVLAGHQFGSQAAGQVMRRRNPPLPRRPLR